MTRLIPRALALGVIATLLAIGAASATPGAGASPSTLGRGTVAAGDKIKTDQLKLEVRDDLDVVTQTITITPGGHTGWHSHPGPVFVTIKAGTMTFYDGDDPTCTPVQYATGDAFIDAGLGHVHIARNEGTTNLVLYATYLLPVGAPLRTDEPAPGNCPF
ncbi:MAG TPA: cupin domain-containing protein [Candidatus Limnocylindrales bacterium]|jgi:quercetin dioxygenase-like cupin family protein